MMIKIMMMVYVCMYVCMYVHNVIRFIRFIKFIRFYYTYLSFDKLIPPKNEPENVLAPIWMFL